LLVKISPLSAGNERLLLQHPDSAAGFREERQRWRRQKGEYGEIQKDGKEKRGRKDERERGANRTKGEGEGRARKEKKRGAFPQF